MSSDGHEDEPDEEEVDEEDPPEDTHQDEEEEDEGVPESVQEGALDHPHRKAIVELLRERPGLNKNQIAEELGLDVNVVDHHIDKLEHEAQLVVTKDSAQGKEVLCFLTEDVDHWENENTRILFGRRTKRVVALFIAEYPGRTTREIAEALRLSPWTVRYHLRTLIRHGLVDRHASGQTKLYEPAKVLTAWVEEVGQGFERPWEG